MPPVVPAGVAIFPGGPGRADVYRRLLLLGDHAPALDLCPDWLISAAARKNCHARSGGSWLFSFFEECFHGKINVERADQEMR